MPIIRSARGPIYFAHVPKCGGTAVQDYLHDRFGVLAFEDRQFLSVPPHRRWSRTSPQHIDAASLARLFPEDFFAASFGIVRHPVSRIVSAYHFQLEVEHTVSRNVSFTEWLETIAETREEDPFQSDNHVRPMTEIIPEGAQVFHLEHGLDAMVPWLDAVEGAQNGPRFVGRSNVRKGGKDNKVTPSPADMALIEEIYAADFTRFGYTPGEKMPSAAPIPLSPEAEAARDAARAAAARPSARLSRALKSKLGKLRG